MVDQQEDLGMFYLFMELAFFRDWILHDVNVSELWGRFFCFSDILKSWDFYGLGLY